MTFTELYEVRGGDVAPCQGCHEPTLEHWPLECDECGQELCDRCYQPHDCAEEREARRELEADGARDERAIALMQKEAS